MKRMTAVLIGALALAGAPQEGKRELRYAFKKGDAFPYAITYGLGVRLDQVPEVFQGVMAEDLLDLKVEGTLDVKVTDVAPDGTATLEGTWRKLTAKGHMLVNDVDFKFDRDAKTAAGAAEKKEPEPADPALDGLLNLEDQLRRAVDQPLILSADALGRLKIKEGGAKAQELEGIFRSLNGVMGALPKEKVGKGDAWKDQTKVSIPAAAGSTVEVPIATENVYEGDEELKNGPCALLKSKFKVGQMEKKEDPNNLFNLQFKTSGEGEGKTWFDAKAGRAAKTQSLLKVRVHAVIPNPGGGDDIELNATVKMEQNAEIGK